ncbi:MAG TPA: acyl-CoA dehydrogenase family protein [Candidatus Acidoferrales bacterium]|nr:acyl-CoA dehydrogenase family protein [Candidatus Acidoferrales bacterium]
MDFSFNSDQLLVRDTVRQFMEAEMRPLLREYDRTEKFPAKQVRRLGELGCCGMLIPEEYGGSATDTITYALMIEEVARVCASTAVTLSVTNSVAAAPILKHGTDTQKKKYLPRLAHGEVLGGFCLTEPGTGSDAAGIQTRAVPDGDSYIINGTKSWVTNGGVSGVYVVFAKTDPAAGSRGVTAFLVEPSFPGFRVSRYEDKMGLRLSRSAEIVFEDCRVPVENLLGVEGQGLRVALGALDGGRIGIAAQSVGVAQGAFEAAVRYAKQRRTFGHPIAEYQAIQWMIADMATEIEAARALTHYAAGLRDVEQERRGADGDRSHVGPHSARAKLYASEMANRVCARAVQIHGSVGYSRETDVERYYRDARVLTIYEGTSEMQRLVIARDLLRRSS